MKLLINFFLLSLFSLLSLAGYSQDSTQRVSQDTLKDFTILRGPSMRMIKTDTGTIQTIAGGAIIQQGGTKFYADSLALNTDTRRMAAFGKVHINDGDTVHIYSEFLNYFGDTKTAFLRNNVSLTGKKGTLTTQELDYNLESGIGNYYKGGRIVNNKNVITSTEGTYYADTKDIYFKKNVKMDGPKDHIRADSLIYNMNNAGLTFISTTHFWNKELEVNTAQGRYDTQTGDAFFSSRTTIIDSSGRVYTSDRMAVEGKSGNVQMEGNGVVIDTANTFVLLSNQIFMDRKNNSMLATKKPLVIFTNKKDSTYLAADIIFTGLAKMVENGVINSKDSTVRLNPVNTEKIGLPESDSAHLSSRAVLKDSLIRHNEDSLFDSTANKTDTLSSNAEQSLRPVKDSTSETTNMKESVQQKKETATTQKEKKVAVKSNESKSAHQNIGDSSSIAADSIRYFIAFHNVRMYNDSVQTVCDSLFFSTQDSVFRLFYDPIVWNGNTQVTGDTMYLFTKNKEAERLYAFEKTMVINKTKEGFYNQLAGKTLNAYFKDRQFDHIRVKGSRAESVYYMQDKDSAYVGLSRMEGDVIDMLFEKGELNKVVYINKVKGMMYPMDQIPNDQKLLKGFEWLEDRRPKNKAELFQ